MQDTLALIWCIKNKRAEIMQNEWQFVFGWFKNGIKDRVVKTV